MKQSTPPLDPGTIDPAKLLSQWQALTEQPESDVFSLNGSQIASIMQICKQVSSKTISPSHAMIMLSRMIDYDDIGAVERAYRFLAPIEAMFLKEEQQDRRRESERKLQQAFRPVGQTIVVIRSQLIYDGDAEVYTRPQSAAFRGSRIIIPDDIAPHFDILDIRIGNRSQFSSYAPHSAMLYAARVAQGYRFEIGEHKMQIAEAAVAECGREFPFETCQCSQDLSFSVRLKDGHPPSIFEAMILGIRAS